MAQRLLRLMGCGTLGKRGTQANQQRQDDQEQMMSEWQPIETFPIHTFDKETWYKDGHSYLFWTGHVVIGAYGYTQKGKGRFRSWYGNILPSYWMPLPESPKDKP